MWGRSVLGPRQVVTSAATRLVFIPTTSSVPFPGLLRTVGRDRCAPGGVEGSTRIHLCREALLGMTHPGYVGRRDACRRSAMYTRHMAVV